MKFKGEENNVLWESYINGGNTRYHGVALAVVQELYGNSPEQFSGWMEELMKANDNERENVGKKIIDALRRQFSEDSNIQDLISKQLSRHGMAEEDAEEDFMDDDLGDDFSDDGIDDFDDDMDFSDDLDDGLGGGEAEGMVMEIDPIGPVEPVGGGGSEEVTAQLKKLSEYAKRLYEMKDSAEFEDWQVTAITIASTYVSDVWHRLDAKADFANTGFEQADDFEQF